MGNNADGHIAGIRFFLLQLEDLQNQILQGAAGILLGRADAALVGAILHNDGIKE